MTQLPCFDDLMELANENPDALEQLRKDSCQAYIATIAVEHQPKLQALQDKLDTDIESAENPMDGIVIISTMLSESFYQLTVKLNELEYAIPNSTMLPPPHSKNIVSLAHWRAKKNLQ